jgi:hypothetical protein
MGAVLGIAAFGRTQEKLGGANNGGIQTPATGFQSGSSTFGQPQSGGFGTSGSYNAPATGFGQSAPSSFGGGGFGSTSPAPSFGAAPTGQVITGFGGKPAPFQPQQPEL